MQNILPEIIDLVSWMSTVLCPIPDSFFSSGLEPSMNWMYAQRSRVGSFSNPSGHWISYEHSWVTLVVESSLSAANLVFLLGEELDHCCGCSSSLSAADLVPLSGEEQVHRCHHVSVQIMKMLFEWFGFSLYCSLCWVQVWSTSTGECTSAGLDVGWVQTCNYGAVALLLRVVAALT